MLPRKLIQVAKWSSRFRFSTGHFLRAAENIFTQQSIKDVLYDHTRTRLFFKLLMPVEYLNILLHSQLDPESQQCSWATARKATSFAHPGRNIKQQEERTEKAHTHLKHKQNKIHVAGLAQVEERFFAEREVADSISGSGPILGVWGLKKTE